MIENWHNTFTLDSKKKRKQKGNALNIEAFPSFAFLAKWFARTLKEMLRDNWTWIGRNLVRFSFWPHSPATIRKISFSSKLSKNITPANFRETLQMSQWCPLLFFVIFGKLGLREKFSKSFTIMVWTATSGANCCSSLKSRSWRWSLPTAVRNRPGTEIIGVHFAIKNWQHLNSNILMWQKQIVCADTNSSTHHRQQQGGSDLSA